jgi:dTDP-4-amino-4,6-dideoxygalactose transaminase
MITKSAEDQSNFTQNLIFTENARTAWGHILSGYRVGAQPKVLLPAYIGYTEREGSGVFDPIEENLATYQFYKVDESLRIVLDDFERLLASGNVNIALVIHYFGLCRNDMEKIKQLCKKYEVVLVEDCAHAFQLGIPNQKIGNYGDFSFYSLHKYLATSSGGILKVNSNVFELPSLPETKKISQDVLEQYAKTEFIKVSSARINNFLSYSRLLQKHENLKIMFELQDGEIPQSFPIKIKNSNREKLYFHMINNGIPVTALYYRLIDQIEIEQFPGSFTISNEILNLPVHQDINQDDVQKICIVIADFFEKK